MPYMEKDRRVELTLLGFKGDAQQSIPGGGQLRVLRDGSKGWVRPEPMSANETWSTAIDRLMSELGGPEEVSRLIKQLNPTVAGIIIFVPFDSPYQENNGLTASTVRTLAESGLELDVVPLDFDARNLTHLADGYI